MLGKNVSDCNTESQSALVVEASPVKVIVNAPGATRVAAGTTAAEILPGKPEGKLIVSPIWPSVSVTTISTILSSGSLTAASTSTSEIAVPFSI